MRIISPQPGIDPPTVQPVASRYTDWATRPNLYVRIQEIFKENQEKSHLLTTTQAAEIFVLFRNRKAHRIAATCRD